MTRQSCISWGREKVSAEELLSEKRCECTEKVNVSTSLRTFQAEELQGKDPEMGK